MVFSWFYSNILLGTGEISDWYFDNAEILLCAKNALTLTNIPQ